MGDSKEQKPADSRAGTDEDSHVHHFNTVLGVKGDIYGPDDQKKVIYGCAGCDAEEVR